MITRTLKLNGEATKEFIVDLPTNQSQIYKFMNIQNTTDYVLQIVNNGIVIVTVQPVSDVTITIPVDVQQKLTFVFNLAVLSSFSTNVCTINFNVDSLNYNSNMIAFDIYKQNLPSNLYYNKTAYPNTLSINVLEDIKTKFPNTSICTSLTAINTAPTIQAIIAMSTNGIQTNIVVDPMTTMQINVPFLLSDMFVISLGSTVGNFQVVMTVK